MDNSFRKSTHKTKGSMEIDKIWGVPIDLPKGEPKRDMTTAGHVITEKGIKRGSEKAYRTADKNRYHYGRGF